MEDLAERIKYFLEDEVIRPKRKIEFSDNLIDSGMIDSFGVVQLVTFIEKEFKVTLNREDLNEENLRSIREMVLLIKRKINPQEKI